MNQLKQLPLVSFVVPLYNHLAHTQEMLSSLQAFLPENLDYEIILVDDGSSDGTAAWIDQLADPSIKSLLSSVNRGYAKSCNDGVRLANGAFVCLLNNDLLFKPGWLEPLLEALESSELNAGVVGNIQFKVSDGSVDHAGVYLTSEAQLQHINNIPNKNKKFVKNLAVTGACLLLRKSDFDAAGGFDDQFLNGCEDIDLCFKIRAAGKEIYLSTHSEILHHVSLTRKDNPLQNIRNSQRLFSRWRKEFKQELSNIWLDLLRSSPQAYADKINGTLKSDFLNTPNLAARIIAQSMLNKEEAHWAKALEGRDALVDVSPRVSWTGLSLSQQHNACVLENRAVFNVDGLDYSCNFYICGRRINDLSSDTIIKFEINGIQQIDAVIDSKRNINAGVIDPLFIPGIANAISVETTEPIIVTHLVINDQVVDLY